MTSLWVCLHEFQGGIDGRLEVQKGAVLKKKNVEETRSHGWIYLHEEAAGKSGWIPETHVVPMTQDFSTSEVLRAPDEQETKDLKVCSVSGTSTCAIEPSLSTILQPVTIDTFLTSIWNKKILVSSGERAYERFGPEFQSDFLGFDTEKLVESASMTNLWSRDSAGKLIQRDVNRMQALSLFNEDPHASLYVKASAHIEMKYIRAIASGMKSLSDQESYAELPGEVEIFISKKGHHTAMHMDYMHNFTIQVKGVKKWRLRRCGKTDPMDNFSIHRNDPTIPQQQLMIHQLYSDMTPSDSFEKGDPEFSLTPGSVMYFPAGWYHEVTSETDSLSINFSIMPIRWCDILSNSLQMLMWQSPLLRSAAFVGSPSADATAKDALTEAACLLSDLRRYPLLSKAAQQGCMNRFALFRLEEWESGDPQSTATLRRSPLASAICSVDSGEEMRTVLVVQLLFGNANRRPLFRVRCSFPSDLLPLADSACQLRPNEIYQKKPFREENQLMGKLQQFMEWCGLLTAEREI